jgi:hypothetical protein
VNEVQILHTFCVKDDTYIRNFLIYNMISTYISPGKIQWAERNLKSVYLELSMNFIQLHYESCQTIRCNSTFEYIEDKNLSIKCGIISGEIFYLILSSKSWTKSLSLNLLHQGEKIRDSDLVRFFEDGTKFTPWCWNRNLWW